MLCYPACRLLAIFNNIGFPTPPTPFRLCALRIRAARRSELLFHSSTCHLAMNRSAVSRTPRYHLPTLVADEPTVSKTKTTPNCRGESSVEPSVDRKTARSSLRLLRQIFGGPPDPGVFLSAICANIARLSNCPLFCRIIAPAKKSCPFRMVVLMLPNFVI